ncbi:MAG: hypothetical protein AAGJ37_01485 [Pseudomonadota bacterium]
MLNSHKTMSNRKRNILLLILIALTSILIRLLYSYNFEKSALLYVGIPFFVAVSLLYIVRKPESKSLGAFYLYLSLWSFIVMLGTSVVLFEGFVCVAMFMPIYYFILLLMYLFHLMVHKLQERKKSTLHIHILPVLIVVSAFEGVIPALNFERDYAVTEQIVIDASIEEIQDKLKQPMELMVDRHWLLRLFPMPINIQAESLSEGDVHYIHFVYHRWFVTNTHSGRMSLELTEVSNDYIRTTFLEDTSYISKYLKLKGTEIQFVKLGDAQTQVALKIHYHRFLDPVWYFGPIQEYAIGQTAAFLLSELFIPEPKHEA